MTMIATIGFMACLWMAPVAGHAQASSPRLYHGVLDSALVEYDYRLQKFTPATSADVKRLPSSVDTAARVFVGAFEFLDVSDRTHTVEKRFPAMIVLTPHIPAVLYVNIRGDSTFTARDRYPFTPSRGEGVLPGDQETCFVLPLPGTVFHGYPVRVIESPGRTPPSGEDHFVWVRSARAQGAILLNGMRTLAQFDIGPLTGKVRVIGTYSLDVLGTGHIDPASRIENQYRYDPAVPVMFRVGQTDVAPGAVDERTGTFVMTGLAPGEYIPPMDTGVVLADFAFQSLDGVAHHLSEYRGKYVLIDFWSIGCASCLQAMPSLAAAYATYRSRGLEIIGFNLDEHLRIDRFGELLKDRHSTWMNTSVSIQPTGPALKKFADTHCRVWRFPTVVLIEPTGKIVAMNEELEGAALGQTLERFLPAPTMSPDTLKAGRP